MKRFLFLLPLLFWSLHLMAGEVETNSKVTAVTVYRNLARETRSSVTNIPAGNTEVVISGVTLQMVDPSIQVSVKGDATLLSASVRTNHFREVLAVAANPKAQKLQDSIKVLQHELRWISEEMSVHTGELELVSQLLAAAPSQKEYKPVDLSACADIYRSRFMELKKKLFDLQLRQEGLEARIAGHQGEIQAMAPKGKHPVKEIVLNFWAEAPTTATIKTMYLVNGAGWTPMYDLNVENTARPVNISYKASIHQATGADWKGVDLTVSTSTPGMNNDRPILNPHYVDFVTYALSPVSVGSLQYNSMYTVTGTNSNSDQSVDAPEYVVSAEESDIHVDYKIEIDQSIPSDGNQHICKLKDYSVPATFRYHTVPKLENAAFLLARITDYGQYNLLPGKANVFFEDTYVGQVGLNPQVTGDTLLVSLGRDEKIVVKRTRFQEKVAPKPVSSKIKENFAYQIEVRNNKGVPIDIEVLDQIPLSRTNEIVVSPVETGKAEHDLATGRILWHFKLEAGKTKKLDLVYTIEYPEGKAIAER